MKTIFVCLVVVAAALAYPQIRERRQIIAASPLGLAGVPIGLAGVSPLALSASSLGLVSPLSLGAPASILARSAVLGAPGVGSISGAAVISGPSGTVVSPGAIA